MGIFAAPETWVLVSFIIFVAIVLYLKVPAKVTAALDARAARIRAELEEAQRLREEAQSLLAEYQRKRREAEKEAEDIVSLAREEADRLKVESRRQLEEVIARRTRMAELKISQAEAQAVADVRAAATDAAIAAAGRILADKVTGKAASALVADSIEQVKQRLQ
jgi:F-type H+-transporting ATPase subunit b